MTIAMVETAGPGVAQGQSRLSGPVRLTGRGRIVVLLTVLLLGLTMLTLLSGRAESTTDVERPVATQTVVVVPGQTLWDIAANVAPDRDPRDVVADIVDLNALSDAGSVLAGQSLYLPTY